MSNYHEADVALHGYQAERWWDPKGPAAPLHQINPLRVEDVCRHLQPQDHLLDIGCGAGLFSGHIWPHCAQVTGIDASPAMIEAAQRHAHDQQHPVCYRCETAEDHAENHRHHYHFITCFEMLEHVPHPESVLHACVSMLKPGGHLMVSTLNRTVTAFMKAIVWGEYLSDLIPKGTHRYRDFIHPSEIDGVLSATGMELISHWGLDYQPTQQKFMRTQNNRCNYFLLYRKMPDL